MSMSADVRAWLATQDGPRTVVEIAAALGRPKDARIYRNVHRMWRDGLLERSGVVRHYAFTLGRAPTVRAKTPREELLRRKAERERGRVRRRQAAGQGRTWAQWTAECAQRKQAWLAKKAEAKARRERERLAERAARQAAQEARRAAPKPARPKPAPKPRPVRERVHVAPAPAPVVFESTEDAIKRGVPVIKLDPGACSKPLKRIGKPGVFTITRRKAA